MYVCVCIENKKLVFDPSTRQRMKQVGAQIMGPSNSYLCQFSKDIDSFWASVRELELGAAFKTSSETRSKSIVSSQVSTSERADDE